ncbi:hypothetical protein QJS10_CPB11g02082 [Acorus calamus]|uniref:Vitamin K epoxide reductase domain-containing protein n=1 Tax=Acorus calamus TaxID=4465 RepID=A0AAV9DVN1_ACOCL|nr:hypothetical protein QJS10_CPB11g02082 [Acorus calamus]
MASFISSINSPSPILTSISRSQSRVRSLSLTLSHGHKHKSSTTNPVHSTPSIQSLQRIRVTFVRPVRCDSTSPPPPSNGGGSSAPLSGISTYGLCAGIGALGFLETGYLSYLKLTGAEAFCPAGGGGAGGCGDVLNSDYAVIFGIPLPVFGLVAYGLVASLGLQMARQDLPFGLGRNEGRAVLLASTTSMATASAYFLYLLSTEFAGTSCPYCLFSAFLSFSLFFIMLKDFSLQEIQKSAGIQLSVVAIVIAALSNSYANVPPQSTNINDIDLQPYKTEITTQSSPFAIALAKHLNSIGAKMYGAFWCSHCIEQKQMFGREAVKLLDYVECFPDGAGKGRKMTKECTAAGLEGFPTWLIKDQVLSGEQDLQALAQASGFDLQDFQPS